MRLLSYSSRKEEMIRSDLAGVGGSRRQGKLTQSQQIVRVSGGQGICEKNDNGASISPHS
jgi:hypothetical protein